MHTSITTVLQNGLFVVKLVYNVSEKHEIRENGGNLISRLLSKNSNRFLIMVYFTL